MWQFAEAVPRSRRRLPPPSGVPVTGGNVSFYNQTGTHGHPSHPGDRRARRPRRRAAPAVDRASRPGAAQLVLLGRTAGRVRRIGLGARTARPPRRPAAGAGPGRRAAAGGPAAAAAAAAGCCPRPHDLSDGGLAVALAESCLRGRAGCRVRLPGDPFTCAVQRVGGARDRGRPARRGGAVRRAARRACGARARSSARSAATSWWSRTASRSRWPSSPPCTPRRCPRCSAEPDMPARRPDPRGRGQRDRCRAGARRWRPARGGRTARTRLVTCCSCSPPGTRAASWRCASRPWRRCSACPARCTPGARRRTWWRPTRCTWVRLATGRLGWADAVGSAAVHASGSRADLAPYLPLMSRRCRGPGRGARGRSGQRGLMNRALR